MMTIIELKGIIEHFSAGNHVCVAVLNHIPKDTKIEIVGATIDEHGVVNLVTGPKAKRAPMPTRSERPLQPGGVAAIRRGCTCRTVTYAMQISGEHNEDCPFKNGEAHAGNDKNQDADQEPSPPTDG
jgi:hypothetical protein